MKKHIMLIATLTTFCAACFADTAQRAEFQAKLSEAKEAGNTPHLVQKVRSPLGKEIDALGQKMVGFRHEFLNADVQIYAALIKLALRVEKLEAAEAERNAAREAAKKLAAERKAKLSDKATARETLQGVIKRGQKAAKREGK